ncbi:TonB-dependent receptor [Ferrovum sp. PN-J185]|uniref:TonB-dependent receptor domain-containing protein n=1 Tax=Ferrovum sp. PN-J185 TaxID=1356306 RepID=UPI0007939FB9|nr:TonB-dependent receptor [Ferrovum sp. PN-J185]KXW55344.1 vitamin B12 transporter BtuB precursor [Ferrovum sp. PN-J185]MCC6068497.1 TonB-dependent receptor [Ferrovum sp. PN-J185]MDE1892526.1 TonB-dependent receptor [Betaproteobacteria bacterium]MDE2056873.1 TonB-dependent receptor [Betaproteobacteria bacterium]
MFFSTRTRLVKSTQLISSFLLLIVSFSSIADTQNNNSVQIDPVIVTADMIPKPSSQVIQDHLYISNEQIRAAGQQSLAELLQQQAGFQVATFGDAGNTASVFTRGTNGNHTLLLVDGVRVELTSTGGGIWNSIPLSMIDHIEVIYGPESIYYGADAVGGVVQVFTKQGNGAPSVSAMAGYGSYGTSMSQASISGSTQSTHSVKYSFGVTQENSSGYNTVSQANPYGYVTGATGYQRQGAYGTLSEMIAQGHEIGIHFLAVRDSYLSPNSGEFDKSQNNTTNLSFFTHDQITSNWYSNFTVAYNANFFQYFTIATPSNDNTFTPSYDYKWDNNYTFGLDSLQVIAEHRSQYLNGQFTPAYDYCTNCSLNLNRNIDSLATIYHLHSGQHSLDVGVRADGYSGYGSKLTGSATYGYQITNSIKTHLGAGTAFAEPTFYELYYPGYQNPNLAPEYSKNIEWGINYDDHHQSFGIVLYQNDISNLIQADPNTFISYNIGNAKIQGATISAQKYIGSFNFHGSMDFLNPVDRNTDLVLPLRAEEVGRVGVDYALEKLKLGANLIASSRRYGAESLSAGLSQPIGGYQMFSLNGSYQVTKQWSLFGRWDNVTNMPYQLQYGYNTPGSNVFFGVRYDQ